MGLIPFPPGRIDSGEILFNNMDLTKIDKKSMQQIRGKDIAMIFQEPMTSFRNPVFTVGQQLCETLMFHEEMKKRSTRTSHRVIIRGGNC